MAVLFLSLYGTFLVVGVLLASISLAHLSELRLRADQEEEQLQRESRQKSQLQQQILFWEEALRKQPTSRDVLLNLFSLYQADGRDEQAVKMLNQAKEIDPNYNFPK